MHISARFVICNHSHVRHEHDAIWYDIIILDFLQAILWIASVWHDMAPHTIRNCCHHARVLPVTWNADIANENERRRERDRGRIAEYVDEIIDLLQAMGMSDEDCNVEEFTSPLEEDQMNLIMTLHWVTNSKATLTLSLVTGRWKKR